MLEQATYALKYPKTLLTVSETKCGIFLKVNGGEAVLIMSNNTC